MKNQVKIGQIWREKLLKKIWNLFMMMMLANFQLRIVISPRIHPKIRTKANIRVLVANILRHQAASTILLRIRTDITAAVIKIETDIHLLQSINHQVTLNHLHHNPRTKTETRIKIGIGAPILALMIRNVVEIAVMININQRNTGNKCTNNV